MLPMRYILFRIFAFSIVLLLLKTDFLFGQNKDKYVIVLDAGHGGKDPGCSGKIKHESEITLKIVLKVGKYLEENLDNVKVVYTRKTNIFVPLHERSSIANKAKADAFISIHCNSNPKKTISGTETYVMGLHTSEENLEVAMRENSVILQEEDYAQNYDGFDPNSPLGYIIMSNIQNVYNDKSLQLASLIEEQFGQRVNRYSRGVKQAGYVVLKRTASPSVLVEVGYLSNADEEKFLISDEGQSLIASGIYRAIKEYLLNISKK